MILDLPILQNPWTKIGKKTIWFINRKVLLLGARKFFLKQIKTYFKTTICHFLTYCQKLSDDASPDNYIETLSTNQKMKWCHGREQ